MAGVVLNSPALCEFRNSIEQNGSGARKFAVDILSALRNGE
jgi:hypothetical protein